MIIRPVINKSHLGPSDIKVILKAVLLDEILRTTYFKMCDMKNEFTGGSIFCTSCLPQILLGPLLSTLPQNITNTWHLFSQHQKWSFLLRISSVNVIKSAVFCGFSQMFWKLQYIYKYICIYIYQRWYVFSKPF